MKTLTIEEWNEWMDLFFKMSKEFPSNAQKKLTKIKKEFPTKKVSKNLVSALNEILHMLDADTRDKFFRKIRDKKYESGRARISISRVTEKKLDRIKDKEEFKTYDDVILHLLKLKRK